MKILHVETGRHLYGGAQQVVWLLEGLRDAGVENVLVCPPRSGIDAAARSAGFPVVNVGCAGDHDLVFAFRLRRVIARERPDLLHTHSRRGADWLGGLAARLAHVPAIHSRRVDHPQGKVMARLRYRGYERIVAISENVAAVLRDAGVAPERIVVIRSAVDVERFGVPAARARLAERGVPERAFAIAAAGQLIRRKGHRQLLDAMAAVAGRGPDAHLVIFGQGVLEPELRARAEALGLGGNVHFAGFRDDLDALLGAFDLLVHPALREGLGVILLEAAASGVPVIAFDMPGAREAVADGETGLLVPAGDANALADAVLRLAGDAALRARYGGAGRERMRREFSIAEMADRHISLYQAVLDGRA